MSNTKNTYKNYIDTSSMPIYNKINKEDIFFNDTTSPTTLKVDGTLEVQGRDILKELDEMRESMLLLTRDLKLEELYPELKQAYDDYMDLYRSIKIADKLTKSGL